MLWLELIVIMIWLIALVRLIVGDRDCKFFVRVVG
ncbi:Uncharacterised protein [Enterobacter kobei]|nr:Uncharacterised protein [Enterobacter kobei]